MVHLLSPDLDTTPPLLRGSHAEMHSLHRMEKTVAEALVFLLAYKFGILGSLRIQEAGLTIKLHRLHAPMMI